MKIYTLLALFLSLTTVCTAQWEKLNESFGGNSVNTIVAKDSILFVGTFSFGTSDKIYKSLNNGITWDIANSGMDGASVHTFTIQENDIYAATYSEGIFKSSNNGETWINVFGNIDNVNYYTLAVSETALIIGTDYGEIYRSEDNGNSFELVDYGISNNYIYTTLYANFKFYVASSSGMFVSSDDGISWDISSPEVLDSPSELQEHNGLIYTFSGNKIYCTLDQGIIWEDITNNLPFVPSKRSIGVYENFLLVGTGNGVYFTNNKGQNWRSGNMGLEENDVYEFATIGPYVYASTSVGVYRVEHSYFDDILSVNLNNKGNPKIHVYPNPTNAIITISTEGIDSDFPFNVSIINEFGQLLSVQSINYKENISLDSLPRGIYFIKIQHKEVKQMIKVVLIEK